MKLGEPVESVHSILHSSPDDTLDVSKGLSFITSFRPKGVDNGPATRPTPVRDDTIAVAGEDNNSSFSCGVNANVKVALFPCLSEAIARAFAELRPSLLPVVPRAFAVKRFFC